MNQISCHTSFSTDQSIWIIRMNDRIHLVELIIDFICCGNIITVDNQHFPTTVFKDFRYSFRFICIRNTRSGKRFIADDVIDSRQLLNLLLHRLNL